MLSVPEFLLNLDQAIVLLWLIVIVTMEKLILVELLVRNHLCILLVNIVLQRNRRFACLSLDLVDLRQKTLAISVVVKLAH